MLVVMIQIGMLGLEGLVNWAGKRVVSASLALSASAGLVGMVGSITGCQ